MIRAAAPLAFALALAASLAACTEDDPAKPYCGGGGQPGATALPSVEFASAKGGLTTGALYAACEDDAPVAVLRVDAMWAATSAWHVANDRALPADVLRQTAWYSILVGDRDNAPPTVADASSWLAGDPLLRDVAADGAWAFRRFVPDGHPLPTYVLVNRRTMDVLGILDDPAPEALESELRIALAKARGEAPPAPIAPVLVDNTFTRDQWALLQAMTKPTKAPPDPGNAYGDDGPASGLGRQFFFDSSFSPSGKISCETCHKPSEGFGDARPHAVGVSETDRNSPSIITSAHGRWMFLDGRADSLWAQAVAPFEDAKEYNSSRLYVARRVAEFYADPYNRVFGAKYPLPDFSDERRFPRSGKPGDPAWEGMAAEDKEAVTRVFVNVGKAIAAYERTLRPATDAFDRYVAGESSALNAQQKNGLKRFFDLGCAQCHYGPRLTDDAFHVIRMATGRLDHAPDRGRELGLGLLASNEFRRSSRWSDAPAATMPNVSPSPSLLGAFKTPTLRGVAATAPYGHGGEVPTLAEAVVLIGQRGLAPEDPRAVGTTEPWVLPFSATEADPVIQLLGAFKGTTEWW